MYNKMVILCDIFLRGKVSEGTKRQGMTTSIGHFLFHLCSFISVQEMTVYPSVHGFIFFILIFGKEVGLIHVCFLSNGNGFVIQFTVGSCSVMCMFVFWK